MAASVGKRKVYTFKTIMWMWMVLELKGPNSHVPQYPYLNMHMQVSHLKVKARNC